MMALGWNTAAGVGELLLGPNAALASEDGLGTAVILSLFTDRRAEPDDELPDGADPLFGRRGWIGDALTIGAAPGRDRIGSRLWLLVREKQVEETLRLAEDYAREALEWMVEGGLAAEIEVTAEWVAMGTLGLRVAITPPAGEPATFAFGLRTR
jgi:phage gp46-like protein